MTVEENVIHQGIAADAAYTGCLARDFVNPAYASFAPVVTLCLVPYLSLFVHESYRKLETSDPQLASRLSDNVKTIVARSRHSLKLFEDTKRGVAGQIAYFRDELLPAHAHYFLDNPPPILQPFVKDLKDLGLFSYAGRLYATTQSTSFNLGGDPLTFIQMTPEERRAVFEEYGDYFGYLGAELEATDPTFISGLDPQAFNRDTDDVRASEYYVSIFNGNGDAALNAVLTVFRCMMNFVDSMLTLDSKSNPVYTVFKIRFLALYQILGSLSVLRDEYANLTSQSIAFIDKITGTAEARLIMDPAVKPFRNMLMHYNLNPRVDTARVDVNQPLFGLVPVYFPAYDVAVFTAVIDHCITETAAAMDEWAGV